MAAAPAVAGCQKPCLGLQARQAIEVLCQAAGSGWRRRTHLGSSQGLGGGQAERLVPEGGQEVGVLVVVHVHLAVGKGPGVVGGAETWEEGPTGGKELARVAASSRGAQMAAGWPGGQRHSSRT